MITEAKAEIPHFPYCSVPSLYRGFDLLRQRVRKIDNETLRIKGVDSNHNEGKVKRSLEFLGLIDETGTPTPLSAFLRLEGRLYRANLSETIRRSYGAVADLITESDDPRKTALDFFIGQGLTEAMATKSMYVLLELAQDAEIIPPQVSKTPVRTPRKPIQFESFFAPDVDLKLSENLARSLHSVYYGVPILYFSFTPLVPIIDALGKTDDELVEWIRQLSIKYSPQKDSTQTDS